MWDHLCEFGSHDAISYKSICYLLHSPFIFINIQYWLLLPCDWITQYICCYILLSFSFKFNIRYSVLCHYINQYNCLTIWLSITATNDIPCFCIPFSFLLISNIGYYSETILCDLLRNIEIGSHKTGGCLMQVYLLRNAL